MSPPNLQEIETDPEFEGLSSLEQEKVRLWFLRGQVLTDPDFKVLSPQDKELVATRVMATAQPPSFLGSEILAQVPASFAESLKAAATITTPQPTLERMALESTGQVPELAQPPNLPAIPAIPAGKPSEAPTEVPMADIRREALQASIGQALAQPETPPPDIHMGTVPGRQTLLEQLRSRMRAQTSPEDLSRMAVEETGQIPAVAGAPAEGGIAKFLRGAGTAAKEAFIEPARTMRAAKPLEAIAHEAMLPISLPLSALIGGLVQSGVITPETAEEISKSLTAIAPLVGAPETAAGIRALRLIRREPGAAVRMAVSRQTTWERAVSGLSEGERQGFTRLVDALQETAARGATVGERQAAQGGLDRVLQRYGLTREDLPTRPAAEPLAPAAAIPERAGIEPQSPAEAPRPTPVTGAPRETGPGAGEPPAVRPAPAVPPGAAPVATPAGAAAPRPPTVMERLRREPGTNQALRTQAEAQVEQKIRDQMADVAPGESFYLSPVISAKVGGKEFLIKSGDVARPMGLESPKLNEWRKPVEEFPRAATQPTAPATTPAAGGEIPQPAATPPAPASPPAGEPGRVGGPAETTLYSGIDPALLAKAAQPVVDLLKRETVGTVRAKDLQTGLYELESRQQADLIRAKNVLRAIKSTAADETAAYRQSENPTLKLTPSQQGIVDNVLPIEQANRQIWQKLTGKEGQPEGYVHRIPEQRPNLLQRLVAGQRPGVGNILTRSAASTKRRTMMALVDTDGNRQVVSVKNGRVTGWTDRQSTDMGDLRTGKTTMADLLKEDLAPLVRELDGLKQEQRTLSATKSRQEAAKVRLRNITRRINDLEQSRQEMIDSADENMMRGRVWQDKAGKTWKFDQATTEEIEANTNLKYFKSRTASAVVNFLQLRKAERAYDFLEAFKDSPEFSTVAKKYGEGIAPEGWKMTTLPQFRGYLFEPKTAEVLDWYAKRIQRGDATAWDRVANFLQTAIFFNPLIHVPNISIHWAVEKGVSGWMPHNWPRILRTSAKAIDAVIHQNADYLAALDAGGAMTEARNRNKEIVNLFLRKLGREVEQDAPLAARIAGYLGTSPVRLIKAIYNFSSHATWTVQDVAMLQAAYEKVDRGMPLKEALDETARHIPDYRLPTRILNSAALGNIMQNRKLTMFGAYHYGALKSYGEMVKGLAAEDNTLRERGDALDKMAMLGIVTFVLYPQVDRIVQYLTGKKDVELRRAGASTFLYNMELLLKGERTAPQVLQSVVTPQVATKAGLELALNREIDTGRQIYDIHAPAGTIARQVGRKVVGAVAPLEAGARVAEGRVEPQEYAASLFGVRKARHGAEKIAADIAASHVPTKAADYEKAQRTREMHQAIDAMREGDWTKATAYRQAYKPPLKEWEGMRREARQPELVTRLKRGFSLEESLAVWDVATPEQRKTILPVLRTKIADEQKKGPLPLGTIQRLVRAGLRPDARTPMVPTLLERLRQQQRGEVG